MADDRGKKILGHLTEYLSWIPFLFLLPVAGGASLAERITELPEWAGGAVDLYREFTYPLMEIVRPDTAEWMTDASILALGILVLFARTIFGFFLSAVAFVAIGFLLLMGLNTFG